MEGSRRPTLLLQLRVLRFGFLQDLDIEVGVFPDVEEILIGGASFSRVAGQYIGPAKLQMRQRAQRQVEYDAAVINNLLDLPAAAAPLRAVRNARPRM